MAEPATTPDPAAPPSAAPVAAPAQSQGGDAPPADTAVMAKLTELAQTVQGLAEQGTQYRKGIQTIGERVSGLVNQQQAHTPQPQQQQAPPEPPVFDDAFGRQPQNVTDDQWKKYIDDGFARTKQESVNEAAQLAYNAVLQDYGQAPLAAHMAARVNEFRDQSMIPRYPDAFVNAHKAEVAEKMQAIGTVNQQTAAFFYTDIENRETAAQAAAAQATSQQQTQDATASTNATNIQGATGSPPPPDGGSGEPTWGQFADASFGKAMERPS